MRIAVSIGMFVALVLPAGAQEVGNPYRGQAYAQQMCADCHATGPEDRAGGKPTAPSFVQVANTSGMTGMALAAWFKSDHPTMPNLMVKPENMDDISAYILSLKAAKAQ